LAIDELPHSVLIHGFAVSAKRPLFGYVVELWLHDTGWEPLRILMRPRYAIQLADLIDRAPGRKRVMWTPELMTTDFDETIRVYGRPDGAVLVTTDDISLNFKKTQARYLAAQLRLAAVAHKSTECATLAA